MLRDLAVKLQAMLRAESKARRVASDFEMLVQAKGLAKRPGPMERLDRGLLSLLHQHRGHGGVDLRRNARMCGDALCTDVPYRPSSPASPPSHHRPPHRASNPPDPANRPPLTSSADAQHTPSHPTSPSSRPRLAGTCVSQSPEGSIAAKTARQLPPSWSAESFRLFSERREHGQDGAASRLHVAGEERENLHCIRDLTVRYSRSEGYSDRPRGRIPFRFERGNADSQDGTGEPVDFP